MKDTIIIDLDGTLSNVAHRRHFVQGKRRNYEAFHALLGSDPVNEWCKAIMRQFWHGGYEVIIVSARPASYEAPTRKWLEANGVAFNALYLLHSDNDNTPDQELKKAWLTKYGKENILFIIDDRQKVVDMWRAEGLVCLQCDRWDEKQTLNITVEKGVVTEGK